MADMEFRRMFSNPLDPNNCFVDIQSGSGGTEAQDWAAMLQRMYLRYCERRGYSVEIMEESPGEVAVSRAQVSRYPANMPMVTFALKPACTAWCGSPRSIPETAGILPLPACLFTRKRMKQSTSTSTRQICAWIRSARPAGGQHINKTDSAVRITHNPTGIVVQCQSGRSHRNRADAMAMLKSRLYEAELRKRNEEKQAVEDSKTDIGWGHQIRSYVLDQSRIKDLRTGVETGNTKPCLTVGWRISSPPV